MGVLEIILRVSFVAMFIKLAMATNHIVGGPNGGWDTSSDLQSWASSQQFSVGDNLSKSLDQFLTNKFTLCPFELTYLSSSTHINTFENVISISFFWLNYISFLRYLMKIAYNRYENSLTLFHLSS
jgi:hypothetical protein